MTLSAFWDEAVLQMCLTALSDLDRSFPIHPCPFMWTFLNFWDVWQGVGFISTTCFEVTISQTNEWRDRSQVSPRMMKWHFCLKKINGVSLHRPNIECDLVQVYSGRYFNSPARAFPPFMISLNYYFNHSFSFHFCVFSVADFKMHANLIFAESPSQW